MIVVLGILNELVVLLSEFFPVDEVTHAETESVDLGRIRWSNTLKGCSDDLASLGLSFFLCNFISGPVDVRDKGGLIRDQKTSGIVDTVLVKLIELFVHGLWVNNNTVTKQVVAAGVENTAGKEMERILDPINHNCMASIRSSVESGANVVILGQDVNKLSLAFVTPLGSQNDTEFRLCTIDAWPTPRREIFSRVPANL